MCKDFMDSAICGRDHTMVALIGSQINNPQNYENLSLMKSLICCWGKENEYNTFIGGDHQTPIYFHRGIFDTFHKCIEQNFYANEVNNED